VPIAAPKGFQACEDLNDGYKFLYPFGWQEVAVAGADIVFKDVVEPLETVSVTKTKTDKKDVSEFGDIALVSTVRDLLSLGESWSHVPGCMGWGGLGHSLCMLTMQGLEAACSKAHQSQYPACSNGG
jgi:hypothetical protein